MNQRLTMILLTGSVLLAGVVAAFGFTPTTSAQKAPNRPAPTPVSTDRGNPGGGGPGNPGGPQTNAFRFRCLPTMTAAIDPIVMPGMTGMSHLHQFFGNRTVDENTTAASLRANPATSCTNSADSSAYWVPVLSNFGNAVNPIDVDIAYVKTVRGPIVAHPAGLMLIAGNSKATDAQATSIVSWSCNPRSESATPAVCRPRERLVATIRFPECWDGVNLDSENHKSHVTYASAGACPSGTVALPQLVMHVTYPAQADVSALTLASGSILTMHADFFNGWDQRRFERMVARLR